MHVDARLQIHRWGYGFDWIAQPDETLQRASHAVETSEGVWLLDPLDVPGIDDRIADLGEVAGVAVCSSWHARDAGRFADRYDVPVSIPAWMGRVEARVDAPVRRFDDTLGDTEFAVRKSTPLPSWHEAILYRDGDGTLYVPESLGTARAFTVGDERLGVSLFRRLLPPRSVLSGLAPERVLVGHGESVFTDAPAALADALAGSRTRAPAAFAHNLPATARAFVGALRR